MGTHSRRRPILCLRKIKNPWTLYSPWHPCSSLERGCNGPSSCVHRLDTPTHILLLSHIAGGVATREAASKSATSRIGTRKSFRDVASPKPSFWSITDSVRVTCQHPNGDRVGQDASICHMIDLGCMATSSDGLESARLCCYTRRRCATKQPPRCPVHLYLDTNEYAFHPHTWLKRVLFHAWSRK